ncbi:multidrug efflux SMR transporter [Salinisphaera sp. Q1T1-3]|uniref:DMT family transporter n=1 Tax=Salinisphaera sp. Q1T1-3 TaxID=2321229 RepID=UPI000E7643BC|nr:SMR family transporter [Salinisphaera sp. Q1T1-3]RJS91432.1 QacE family quaternary ammonium compound efflux SMR transporter [Salinisphaera sp. Q1T1-3]
MIAWALLLLAGIFEVLGAHGFQRLARRRYGSGLALTCGGFAVALAFLHGAMQQIPAPIAYGVFTAVGTVGSVVSGRWLNGEPLPPRRLAWLTLVIGAMIGLKLSSG